MFVYVLLMAKFPLNQESGGVLLESESFSELKMSVISSLTEKVCFFLF